MQRRAMAACGAVALLLSFPAFANVDWYMVGAVEFRPYRTAQDHWVNGSTDVWAGSSLTYASTATLTAPVHLPIGATVTSLYCQVVDESPLYDTQVFLLKTATSDDSSPSYVYTQAYVSTSYVPGAVKISDRSSSLIVDWTDGDPIAYHTYHLSFRVDPRCGYSCRLKACAIGYHRP